MGNKELDALEGEWVLVLCDHDGRIVSTNVGEVMRIEDDRMFWPEAGRPASVRKITVNSQLQDGMLTSRLLGVETLNGGTFAPTSFPSPSVDIAYKLFQNQLQMVHQNDDNSRVIFEFKRITASIE